MRILKAKRRLTQKAGDVEDCFCLGTMTSFTTRNYKILEIFLELNSFNEN